MRLIEKTPNLCEQQIRFDFFATYSVAFSVSLVYKL